MEPSTKSPGRGIVLHTSTDSSRILTGGEQSTWVINTVRLVHLFMGVGWRSDSFWFLIEIGSHPPSEVGKKGSATCGDK